MLGKNARKNKALKKKERKLRKSGLNIPTFLIDIQQGRKRPQMYTFGDKERKRELKSKRDKQRNDHRFALLERERERKKEREEEIEGEREQKGIRIQNSCFKIKTRQMRKQCRGFFSVNPFPFLGRERGRERKKKTFHKSMTEKV